MQEALNHKKIPFFRIGICMVAGILSDEFITHCLFPWFILATSSILILSAFYFFTPALSWRIGYIKGIAIILLLCSFGGICNQLRSPKNRNHTIDNYPFHGLLINEEGKHTKTNTRYEVDIFSIDKNKFHFLSKGYLYTYPTKGKTIKQGDFLITNNRVREIVQKNNPGAYNFSRQSSLKGIFYTININDTLEYELINHNKDRLKTFIEKSRMHIIAILRSSLNNKQTIGLAEAMLIGFRDDLDKELLSSYINTGVVHIIAISGMHLGLIFLIINFFTKILIGKKRTSISGILITIPILWLFSLLTGGSASVIRSAIMLSLILISTFLKKSSNGLNTLLASAFILIVHNPSILYDLGFLLSYAAVLSILIFDPLIKKLVYVKNGILKKGWEMISITLAAQILTTPISIFYFHQFPILFLFTNLVAIPLSSVILLSEIALCVFWQIGIPPYAIANTVNTLITFLNNYIHYMEKIPFGMIKHIYIDISSMLLIYGVIFAAYVLCKKYNSINLKLFCWSILLFSTTHLLETLIHHQKNRIIVLDILNHSCIVVQHGKKAVILGDNTLFLNRDKFDEIKEQIGYAFWIKKFQLKKLPQQPCIITLQANQLIGPSKVPHTPISILSGNPRLHLNDLTQLIHENNMLIIDHSNKVWKIRQWEKEADKLLLRFNSIAEKGPYILEN
jgi:competence protein ComEC